MKRTNLLHWTAALLAGFAMMSGSAMAQTADGETPANEGVCDALKLSGVSPGLYGLCVAYCEAQDLDSFDKEPPNTKILDNYNKRKLASDPAMPCVKVPCPCWTAEEMTSISGDATAAACNTATNKLQIIDIAPRTHFAEANTNVGQERCRYIDLNTVPVTVRSFTITQEQAQSCMADVAAACQATGF